MRPELRRTLIFDFDLEPAWIFIAAALLVAVLARIVWVIWGAVL
jgi:hypothetical protein